MELLIVLIITPVVLIILVIVKVAIVWCMSPTPRQNNNGAALETGATQLKVVKQPFFKQVHLLSSSHIFNVSAGSSSPASIFSTSTDSTS